MAVVKADGYGHGAVPSAQAAIAGGATWLAVSSVTEGIELRKAGLSEPILNLGYTPPPALSAAVAAKLALTVYDREGLALLKTAATAIGVHVKVDTGMHRVGAAPEEALGLADLVNRRPELRLAALWTQLALADEPGNDFTSAQLDRFEKEVRKAVGATVADVMTPTPPTCAEDDTVEQVATVLHDQHLSRLPVVRDGKLVGIVSRGDILRSIVQSGP